MGQDKRADIQGARLRVFFFLPINLFIIIIMYHVEGDTFHRRSHTEYGDQVTSLYSLPLQGSMIELRSSGLNCKSF
jgi:hypothetical protein